MANPQVQNDPIFSLPFLYKFGFIISNDATTPNTVLDVGAGQCRDSNDIMDITLGVANPNLQGLTVTAPLLLNAAINGVNGLDTGSLAASTMYAVYAISDSRYIKPTASILTLASNTSPLMPFGYDSSRLIGYWATDSSSHFLLGYMSGQGGALNFTYDAPQATAVTAGNVTTYTAIDLSALVPNLNQLPVSIAFSFTPGAASRTLKMQGANSTGDAVTITGQVTSVVVSGNTMVLAQTKSAKPEINYKVSNAGDAVAINVAGFSFFL